jgi:multidrug efflux system membrane fusion protein
MPVILSAPGTVEPIASVALKPRVDGQVVEVGFKEGDMVEAGALLYRLDDRLVRAQIKQVEAQIARDQASLKDAVSIAERRETLFQKKYASEAAAETARQNVEVLKASIAAGRALLEMQRTQLDYLTIRAPITGRTGSMNAKLGAFVRSADPTPLVTINQTKPISVAFALPQSTLRQLKDALARKAEATVGVKGAKPVSVKGVLSFVDNQIDRTTGTVTGKVTVENMDEVLWPGLAVVVDVTVETRKGLVAVPASAVLPAQQGMIVWVIGADRKVSVRPVVQERVISQTSYLSKGLNDGEQVVTDGQLRLVPGAVVAIRGPAGAGKSAGGGEKKVGPQKSGVGSAGGG